MRHAALLLWVADARSYWRSHSYVGPDFFAGWSFWTRPDPTRGDVEYVDFADAARAGLVNASTGRVYLGVDMGQVAAGRKRQSVRIHSKATFNHGLFVATLDHVPTGCSLWPAFWMYGEDEAHEWPELGEYDIIEGIHTMDRVMTTLHTTADCDQSLVGSHMTWMSGTSGKAADNCDVHAKGQFRNQGCSQMGPAASIGRGFNAAGGGTYAAEWDPVARYIRTWFWPRGLEPLDLMQHRPDPESWDLPYSYFSLEPYACAPSHFANMRLVFDITFCGDLGGPTFERDCPTLAAAMSCPEFVKQHPERMKEAYWSIRALDVYQQQANKKLPMSLRPQRLQPPRPHSYQPNMLLLLVVVMPLLGALGLVTVSRKVWVGETRCLTFYQRCLTGQKDCLTSQKKGPGGEQHSEMRFDFVNMEPCVMDAGAVRSLPKTHPARHAVAPSDTGAACTVDSVVISL